MHHSLLLRRSRIMDSSKDLPSNTKFEVLIISPRNIRDCSVPDTRQSILHYTVRRHVRCELYIFLAGLHDLTKVGPPFLLALASDLL